MDYTVLEPNILSFATELFSHILNSECPVPLSTYESQLQFTGNPQVAVKVIVDSDKSILLTGLRYIVHWLEADPLYNSAYLEMPWWSVIDNSSSYPK